MQYGPHAAAIAVYLCLGQHLPVARTAGLLAELFGTPMAVGKLVFHVFGALAEFERDLIRERTQAGLLAARVRGRLGGRPQALDPRKAQIAQALYQDKSSSIADICRTLRVSRATLYRYVKTGTGEPA